MNKEVIFYGGNFMKKKLFVFLTVIIGGLFILLYNPLKELASSSGEVKAAETYSAFEKFLMSEESGSYTPSTSETITHELNLSFANKVTKTIVNNDNAHGPVSTYITLKANVIIGNNCELTGLHFTRISSNGGYIIMKGNGILSPTSPSYNGLATFDASCIRCDSSFYGNINFAGYFPDSTLTLDYGANFTYSGGCSIIFGANFNGTVQIKSNGPLNIENYLGPKNKIEITATASGYISSDNVKLSTIMSSKFNLSLIHI